MKKFDCYQEQEEGNDDREVGKCAAPTTFDPADSGPRCLTGEGLSESKTYMSEDKGGLRIPVHKPENGSMTKVVRIAHHIGARSSAMRMSIEEMVHSLEIHSITSQ